jgi:hypothetical protein
VSSFAIDLHYCATCEAEALFEQPECGDGHGVDCPEWVCAQCGDALVLGFPLVAAPRRRSRTVA